MGKTIVNVSEAVNIISRTVKGTMAVSIDAATAPKMNKTGNPYFGRITKFCRMDGLIGFDYENSVNNQAAREGKEERDAKGRAWGTLTADRLFVTHKGEYYLQMKVQSTDTPVYKDETGAIVDKATLAPFMPERGEKSSTQSDLEKEIIIRDVKMSNVKGMRFNGGEYEIIPVA